MLEFEFYERLKRKVVDMLFDIELATILITLPDNEYDNNEQVATENKPEVIEQNSETGNFTQNVGIMENG